MTNDNHILFGKCAQPLFTSEQAASRLSKDRGYLIKLISRHPELQPAIKVGQARTANKAAFFLCVLPTDNNNAHLYYPDTDPNICRCKIR